MPEKSHVALTNCFYCLKADRILLATRYDQKGEPLKDLEPLNHKVIDMEPCRECADWMKKGIILIGIDNAKSDPGWEKEKTPNPWRSGGWSVIKDDAFDRIFDGEVFKEFAHKHRFMFVDHKVLVMLGELLGQVQAVLDRRVVLHDDSKLPRPEKPVFDEIVKETADGEEDPQQG